MKKRIRFRVIRSRPWRKAEHPQFKRYVLRSLTWNDQPWGTDFRCVIAGDVAMGIEALVLPLDAQVTRLADAMARSIRSLDDKRRVLDLEQSPAVAPAVRQMRPPATARARTPATQPIRKTSTAPSTRPR